jgi:hypothetical protein
MPRVGGRSTVMSSGVLSLEIWFVVCGSRGFSRAQSRRFCRAFEKKDWSFRQRTDWP